MKEKHKKCRDERNQLANAVKNEKAQVAKLESYSFRLKLQLDEIRHM